MKKITILLLTTFSFAHSGRTDGKGGHYNRSTGEYHYHHGYPAHSICGVNCPYNNIDATNHNSSNGAKSSKSTSKTQNSEEPLWEKHLFILSLGVFTYPLTGGLTFWLISKFKNIDVKYENLIWFIGYIEAVLLFYFLFY